MEPRLNRFALLMLTGFVGARLIGAIQPVQIPNLLLIPNPNGMALTFAPNVDAGGLLDTTGSFFQNFGANQRTCYSCHQAASGWGMAPKQIADIFEKTQGLDPLFRTIDGSLTPAEDVSTLESRRKAYRLLLTRGLIRVYLPMPASADFTLQTINDPYHHATAGELSLYRRPLPSANLGYLRDVMWDGRETLPDADLDTQLGNQANDATLTHTGTLHPLLDDEKSEIVEFEKTLFFAQSEDTKAGRLDQDGARGGPQNLSPVPSDSTAPGFHLFAAWLNSPVAARLQIARGEKLFNERSFTLAGVRGFNDVLGQARVTATCATCHDAGNFGGNRRALRIDIGVAAPGDRDLPVYTFRQNQTGQTLSVTDPGRGLITGKWADLGCFKVPGLRGLSARAPYFHNGSAATLTDAVRLHDRTLGLQLAASETADLVAFLGAL